MVVPIVCDEAAKLALSADQLDLLQGLADGLILPQLAARTGRSERSLRRNFRAIWDALGVDGRAQGLVRAARLGLVR